MRHVSLASCPICSESPRPWGRVETEHGPFEIVRCSGCAFAFVDPRPDRPSLVAYYGESGREGEAPLSACSKPNQRH